MISLGLLFALVASMPVVFPAGCSVICFVICWPVGLYDDWPVVPAILVASRPVADMSRCPGSHQLIYMLIYVSAWELQDLFLLDHGTWLCCVKSQG